MSQVSRRRPRDWVTFRDRIETREQGVEVWGGYIASLDYTVVVPVLRRRMLREEETPVASKEVPARTKQEKAPSCWARGPRKC